MDNAEAIELLNGFSEDQKGQCNLLCDNKIFTEEVIINNDLPVRGESTIPDGQLVAEHLNAMTQAEIDDNISPSLQISNKLSRRPC